MSLDSLKMTGGNQTLNNFRSVPSSYVSSPLRSSTCAPSKKQELGMSNLLEEEQTCPHNVEVGRCFQVHCFIPSVIQQKCKALLSTCDGEGGHLGPRETAIDGRDVSPLGDSEEEVLWKKEEYQGTASVCLMKHELREHS